MPRDDSPKPRSGRDPAPARKPESKPPIAVKTDAGTSGSLAQDLEEVQRSKPERAFNVGAIVGIALTAAAAIFVFQNRQSVEFDWLWFSFSMPLWTALLGGVASGVVLLLTIVAIHVRRQGRIDRRSEAAGRLRRALTRNRQVPKQA